MANKEHNFRAVGDFGIEVAEDGDHLLLRIPTSVEGARMSASGKTRVVASSGGWVNIPGSDMRLNLNAGVRATVKQ